MADRIAVDGAGAAELLGISERTLRDLTKEGRIPTIDLGPRRSVIYSVEALRRWALDASQYDARQEEDDGEAGDRRARRGQAVQAPAGRALGSWPSTHRTKDGVAKRRYLYGSSRDAVLAKRDELRTAIAGGLQRPDTKLTVGRHLDGWLASKRDTVRPSTWVSLPQRRAIPLTRPSPNW